MIQEGKISFEEQQELLGACKKGKKELCEVLAEQGLSYDDLRYRHNGQSKLFFEEEYIDITDFKAKPNGIPAIGFFSGAGGLDIGFERAGFDGLASIEANELFCETLRSNFRRKLVIGPPLYPGDIRKKKEIAEILRNELKIESPFDGVFHGGPPCQPFSVAANQRFSKNGDNFKRVGFDHEEYGNLLFDYIWFIKEFKPKAFLMENVPGLKDVDNGEQLAYAIKLLEKAGYAIHEPTILNAANFGVPQNRQRLFIIGHRTKGSFEFPRTQPHFVPCYKALEKPAAHLPNHQTRQHKAESVTRYMELRFGQRDQLGRVDRLDPALPSKTIIAGGTKGGGRSHLHPFFPRTLSVRECARLQTFPDDFVFHGPPARQFTQVGNAVPPLLAFQLAYKIHECLFSGGERKEKAEAAALEIRRQPNR